MNWCSTDHDVQGQYKPLKYWIAKQYALGSKNPNSVQLDRYREA